MMKNVFLSQCPSSLESVVTRNGVKLLVGEETWQQISVPLNKVLTWAKLRNYTERSHPVYDLSDKGKGIHHLNG
ncbi:hypothetical protein CEXT_438291 [Caerostris extrusa]|uniref:Uncharacterized protein n=1 Tax=Caerostris extrusa TaxID=172846 RepID=A0AAV4VUY5_CAEEX|nr:hypothetical protein CEXT_438291 [Caerostris extrusa]